MTRSISVAGRALRITAMTLALATSAVIGSALADSEDKASATNSYGSVEGFGGLAGRVGNKVPYSEPKEATTSPIGSVEGFGGFAGRVGNPADTAVAGTNEQQAAH